MRAPRSPTTASRSCCSTRPASPPVPARPRSRRASSPRPSASSVARPGCWSAASPARSASCPSPPSSGSRTSPPKPSRRPAGASHAAAAAPGGRLTVSLGDALLPLEGCDFPPARPVRVLRLTDGRVEIGYAVDEVIDMLQLAPEIVPAAATGDVRGVCRVGDAQAEVLDLHWLFARHASPNAGTRPICVLPEGDPFMATILRPLVESAGYRVVAPGEPEAADAEVAILSSAADSAPASARILRLRDTVEPSGRKD